MSVRFVGDGAGVDPKPVELLGVGSAHRGVDGGVFNGGDRRFFSVARFFQPQ